VVWNAKKEQSVWLRRYRPMMLTGIITVLILATFIDGSYRFWDRPFHLVAWGKLVFIGASAWAALFCYIARDEVLQPATPRRILKWTVGLTIGIGVFVFWQTGVQRTEYFLHKTVIEHPNDEKAWLDLGAFYSDEGDRLANEADDVDEEGRHNSPPDPTPYYNEALNCLDRAVKLGATGFRVYYALAYVADAVGKEEAAVAYGQEGLRFASFNTSGAEEDDAVKWLHEMIARNTQVTQQNRQWDREQLVRKSRQKNLPRIVRWVFEAGIVGWVAQVLR
jgi:tetratricopeptide (TPR) repeat protein